MKSEIKYIVISLGVALAGVAVTASGVYSSNRQIKEFMKTPLISDQESLEAALNGEKQVYCLTNMPVSGSAAEDPLDILQDSYVYLYYGKETCKEESSRTGEPEYTWENVSDGSLGPFYASEIRLFDTYPVTAVEYVAIGAEAQETKGTLQAEQVKEEYREQTDGYYYPEQIGDQAGNIRYALTAIPDGQEIALYAEVGDGEIKMEYNKDMASYVISNGTQEDLASYFAGDAGLMRTLIGIMLLIPFGALMLLTTILFAITSLIAEKKKAKSGANVPRKKK